MNYPVKTLKPESGPFVMALIEHWGYSRELTDRDVNSVIFELGDKNAFVWFHPLIQVDAPGMMAIHMAKNPTTRGLPMRMDTWPSVVKECQKHCWAGLVLFKSDDSMVEFVKSLGFKKSKHMTEWHVYDLGRQVEVEQVRKTRTGSD